MFLANNETGTQNQLLNNAKLSAVMLSTKTNKAVLQYPTFLHFKSIACAMFLKIIIK
jgi:hypothetical protein